MESREAKRERLLEFLGSPEPILKDEDYPEFRDGAEDWVRRLWDEDLRLEKEKLGNWVGGGSCDE